MKADFDKAAKNYDNHFTYSEIGKIQRNLVYETAIKHFKKGKKILEINCGTGEDAIWLANQKMEVTATDISKKMIEIAKSKSNLENLKFKVLDITKLSEETEKFDILFSNFGGLNCLTKPELAHFFNAVFNLLNEKGKVSLVIMPKNTFWEQFYFLLKFDFKNAFRRKKEVAIANVDGENVSTYYYNPKDIVNLSETNFNVLEIKPIGFFIPPSYLEPFFKNKKVLLNFLNCIENYIKNWSSLSKHADHYIIILQKK